MPDFQARTGAMSCFQFPPTVSRWRSTSRVWPLVALVALSACGSGPAPRTNGATTAPPGPASAGAPIPPAPPPEPPRPSLAAEQSRFTDLFRDTPVVFAMQADGSLRVEVPLRYSFDPGGSAVKPPLAKVLDLLAASQRKASSRMLVIAPTDKRSKALALATDRAGSVRDYLAGRGVAPPRFAISAGSDSELVRIVVSEAGAPKLLP